MILIVKYFGAIADITEKKQEQFFLDDATNSLYSLRLKLEERYPQIKKTTYSFALNQSIANNDAVLNENDEIALLPPFAGG